MPKPSERFKFLLADAMEARGLTQQALSDACGINRAQIAAYLTARSSPNLDNLAALALALGVPSDSLLGIKPLPLPPKPRAPTSAEMAMWVIQSIGVDDLAVERIRKLLRAEI